MNGFETAEKGKKLKAKEAARLDFHLNVKHFNGLLRTLRGKVRVFRPGYPRCHGGRDGPAGGLRFPEAQKSGQVKPIPGIDAMESGRKLLDDSRSITF